MADAAGGGGDKNKRRGKYIAAAQACKRKKQVTIPHGCQGFLITCDGGRESQCAREAINLLSEFLEESKNAASLEAADGEVKPAIEKKDSEGNIDDRLEAEISELREKKAGFSNVDTGCNGIVFIEMPEGTEVRPSVLAERIVRTVASTKRSRTRFTLKLLPVELTCYASAEEVSKCAKALILKHFPLEKEPAFKFGVVYEARANTGIDRGTMIDAVARLVPKPHSVDLKNPDKTIMMQIVKTTCTIGVLSEFKGLSKYNLRELGSSARKSKQDKCQKQVNESQAAAEDGESKQEQGNKCQQQDSENQATEDAKPKQDKR